jgi:iron(III) transport system substrate-binding protein
MKHLSTKFAAAAASIAIVAALAGCSAATPVATPSSTGGHRAGYDPRDVGALPADWSKVEDAAVKEGTVTVYTSTPIAQIQPIIDAFNKIYPEIKVTIVSDALASLTARYEQEHDSGAKTADLLESSGFEALIAAHPTWFKNLYDDKSYFPQLSDYPSSVLPKSRPHSVTVGAYTQRIVYNTNLLKKADLPKTWGDLTNPKYKGKMGLVDPRNSDTYAAVYQSLATKYGSSWLTKIAAQKPTLLKDGADATQQVAAGTFEIAFVDNQSKAASFIKAGAPVKLLDLSPSPLGATTLSVPLNAPHPAAAQLFGNFLMTAQAQELECTEVQVGSLNPKAAGDCTLYPIPSDASVVPLALTPDQRTAVFTGLGLQ